MAVIAIAWMSFMTIIVLFPATPNPAPSTMNYTAVVLGGVLILALGYFYLPVYGGVHWFKGPVRTIFLVVEEDMKRSEKSHEDRSDEKKSQEKSEARASIVAA